MQPDVAPPDDLPAVLAWREARRAGVLPALRAGYVPAARGVRVVRGADPLDADVRTAVAMAAVHPDVTLGGWAAARLHERACLAARGAGPTPAARRGVAPRRDRHEPPVLDGRPVHGRTGELLPVLLLAPPEVRLRAGPGRRLVRSRVLPEERVRVSGLWVTSPLRSAFDLARFGRHPDAVVGLDRMRALGLVRSEDLADLIRERPRWRGSAEARRALSASADGVESPQESRMRLVWLAAGLPVPRCNPVVLDADGRFVARVDLLDESSGVVAEYDGAVHSAADRRSADARRQERLQALGLEVLRATSVDLATPTARARWQGRARAARERALARRGSALWRTAPAAQREEVGRRPASA